MSEQEWRLGHDVVVDAVNDSEAAQPTWRTAATRTGVHIEFVHLVISVAQEHERSAQWQGSRRLTHVGEPTWSDVQRRREDYAVWSHGFLEFDTAALTAEEVADVLTARLSMDWRPASLSVVRAGTRLSSGSTFSRGV